MITNPPYGERLGERAELPQLYRALGDTLARSVSPAGARAVLAGDAELGRAMRLRADKRYVLYNGALECRAADVRSRAPRDEPSARAASRCRPARRC